VGLDHLREVHPVHVIRTDTDDDVGLLVPDQVEALEDRVGAARYQRLPTRCWAGTGAT